MWANASDSSGATCTNWEDVQHAVQSPHGTSATAPERIAPRMLSSQVAKSPAARSRDKRGQSVGEPTGSASAGGGSVGAATNGRANVSVVPPGWLVAQVRPLWASMMRLQM